MNPRKMVAVKRVLNRGVKSQYAGLVIGRIC